MPYTDLSYLREISSGTDTIVKRAVEKFLETTPPIIAEMHAALAAKDHTEVGLLAHKLKSSAAFMGAEELRDLLIRIERVGKDNTGSHEELPALLQRTSELAELVYAELRAE